MHDRTTLSHADAAALVDAAFRLAHRAHGTDAAIACAVVGSMGELIAYGAQDETGPMARRLATRKAYTAVQLKRHTRDVRAAVDSGAILLSTLGDDDLLPIAGGVALRHGGTIVGAIGVSGMTPDQDHALASGAASSTDG